MLNRNQLHKFSQEATPDPLFRFALGDARGRGGQLTACGSPICFVLQTYKKFYGHLDTPKQTSTPPYMYIGGGMAVVVKKT